MRDHRGISIWGKGAKVPADPVKGTGIFPAHSISAKIAQYRAPGIELKPRLST